MPTDVLTQRNDISRTGANTQETSLTPSTIDPAHFGKLFTRRVDGHIYAQPLYVSGLAIPGQGTHNVVYVATMHNSVYAFDADDPNASAPLWHVNLGPSFSTPPPPHIPPVDGSPEPWYKYSNIQVEIGILSTPAIDRSQNTIYVVPYIMSGPDPSYWLYALDITNGSVKHKVQIQGTVPGTGVASAGGHVAFNSKNHSQRPGLLLMNGVVYIAFASFADIDDYHGWVFAYDATSLAQTGIYNVTPNGEAAGIWQAGHGPAGDANHNVYLLTGNGTFAPDG